MWWWWWNVISSDATSGRALIQCRYLRLILILWGKGSLRISPLLKTENYTKFTFKPCTHVEILFHLFRTLHVRYTSTEFPQKLYVGVNDSRVGVFDTLSDSIQYLNFAKKWFIQFSIQYCFTQDSIQNIIQFKKNLLIQFKRLFNSIVREWLILVE